MVRAANDPTFFLQPSDSKTDAVFRSPCGRHDLPGGDPGAMDHTEQNHVFRTRDANALLQGEVERHRVETGDVVQTPSESDRVALQHPGTKVGRVPSASNTRLRGPLARSSLRSVCGCHVISFATIDSPQRGRC